MPAIDRLAARIQSKGPPTGSKFSPARRAIAGAWSSICAAVWQPIPTDAIAILFPSSIAAPPFRAVAPDIRADKGAVCVVDFDFAEVHHSSPPAVPKRAAAVLARLGIAAFG